MRGAPGHGLLDPGDLGIIPADAGSTGLERLRDMLGADHPRGCGEHWSAHLTVPIRLRIIPADAGSTWGIGLTGFPAWDHPRGCGEHKYRKAFGQATGSSPRMRGAPPHAQTGYVRVRIIPADAGSTVGSSSPRHAATDHPRGCGEHLAQVVASPYHQGSSPRMRGAPESVCSDPKPIRIIPADAGSTLSVKSS